MILSIIFLPLFGSLLSGFFGRKLGFKGACFITMFCMLFAFLLSVFYFFDIGFLGNIKHLVLISWVNAELFNVNWGFLFDSLTVVMLIVVTSISSLVHLYSIEYMSHDPHLPRFMSYLSLFTFFMLILVTADNILQMFVGWEGVGLCSYLLINFWYTRIQANKAAIKAMLMNRIGDIAIALAIFLSLFLFSTLDYLTIFGLVPSFSSYKLFFVNISAIEVLAFLLFLGAVGKSAQLGLHTWLPDAMEGPTPVSALIHAATMVTAGVFLIARCSPIFEHAPITLNIVTFVGGLTALFAASTGLVQNDLKKVIAYSTCSQLGYMIFACGISNYSVAIFHLANHAFFKALLFLGAGSVIHGVSDEQDMRKMGGLRRLMPFTYATMFIGSLALMGFPFLSGFYSKDVILESAFSVYTNVSHFSYWMGSVAAFCTAFYSIRLLYLTFLSNPNGKKPVILEAHEPGLYILAPLGILAIPSIFVGFLTKDFFIGFGNDFWGSALFQNPLSYAGFDFEFINFSTKMVPLMFSFIGLILALILYVFFSNFIYNLKLSFWGKTIYEFFSKKWFFDRFYNEIIAQKILKFGLEFGYVSIDRGIIEVFGPFGVVNSIVRGSNTLSTLQSGYLYHYTFIIFLGFLFLIFFYSFSIKISSIALLAIFLLCFLL